MTLSGNGFIASRLPDEYSAFLLIRQVEFFLAILPDSTGTFRCLFSQRSVEACAAHVQGCGSRGIFFPEEVVQRNAEDFADSDAQVYRRVIVSLFDCIDGLPAHVHRLCKVFL